MTVVLGCFWVFCGDCDGLIAGYRRLVIGLGFSNGR